MRSRLRWYTGRHKILAFYRAYHGGTAGAITLTGDPRRWAAEPGLPGIVHVLNPYHGIQLGWDNASDALAYLEETIQLEGPTTIAVQILEPSSAPTASSCRPMGIFKASARSATSTAL